METRELLPGGANGAVVVSGKSGDSELILVGGRTGEGAGGGPRAALKRRLAPGMD